VNDTKWWLWSAGLVAALMVMFGVGNIVEDDGGPMLGRIIFAAVLIGGASLVVAGMRTRPRRPGMGSRLVAAGVVPGAAGIALFWFPPAVAVGVLAVVTSVAAYRDSQQVSTSAKASALAVLGATLLMILAAAGLS